MHSGASKRSDPSLIVRPSGSCSKIDCLPMDIYQSLRYSFRRVWLSLPRALYPCQGHNLDVDRHELQQTETNHSPNITKLLFDLSDGFEIGGSVECISSHKQELDQVSSHISTGNIQARGEMWECKSVVYGDDVSYTVSRIHYHARIKT